MIKSVFKKIYDSDYLGAGELLTSMGNFMFAGRDFLRKKWRERLLMLGRGVEEEKYFRLEKEAESLSDRLAEEIKKRSEADSSSRTLSSLVDSQRRMLIELNALYNESLQHIIKSEEERAAALKRAEIAESRLKDLNRRTETLAEGVKRLRKAEMIARAKSNKDATEALQQWEQHYAAKLIRKLGEEKKLSREVIGKAVSGVMDIMMKEIPFFDKSPLIYLDFVNNRIIGTSSAREIFEFDFENIKMLGLFRKIQKEFVGRIVESVRYGSKLENYMVRTNSGKELYLSIYPISHRFRNHSRRIGAGLLLYHPSFKNNPINWLKKTAGASRKVARTINNLFPAFEKYFTDLSREMPAT